MSQESIFAAISMKVIPGTESRLAHATLSFAGAMSAGSSGRVA